MGNTLLAFVNKDYQYNGERDIRDKGVTIRHLVCLCLDPRFGKLVEQKWWKE